MSSSSTTCSNCGYIFPEHEPRVPCSNCSSTIRIFHENLDLILETHIGFQVRQHRSGFPGWLVTMVSRIKHSWHGILAHEKLTIDRSDPHKTVKTHHVEERQPNGSWRTVHDERVEYKAKRRPRQRSEDKTN